MTDKLRPYFSSFIVFFSLFVSTSSLLGTIQPDNNWDNIYIHLSEDVSNIAALVYTVSELDTDHNSPLQQLKKHIDNGFIVGYAVVVKKALEYAKLVIEKNYNSVNSEYADNVTKELNLVINQIENYAFPLDTDTINRARLNTLLVSDHLEVMGKSHFHRHVRAMHGIHANGHLEVDRSAQFHADVVVDGGLSVTDLVVASCIDNLCINNLSVSDAFITNASIENLSVISTILDSTIENLTVTGTLSANNTTANNATIINLSSTDAVINDLTVVNCMNDLCVNNLSAADQAVGLLSATDAIIGNETVTLLSSTDAVIADLTVTNCMTNLCVNNLSVTNQTIGSLSVTDIVTSNETVNLLSATDAVITDLTVTNCIANLCVTNLSVNDEIITNSVTIPSLTPAGIVHNDSSGLLSSSLIVNTDISSSAAIVDTKLATISTAGKVANSATTATNTNTPNTIVLRDGSGNFSAGTITATLNGNATTAINFSGSLAGDVTGTQGATVVSLVGGQTAADVAAGVALANAATDLNAPNAIVRRNAFGNFTAGVIAADLVGNATTATTAINFSGSLAGDVTGTQGATVVSLVGGQTAANVAAGVILANAATSTNTPNTIVLRDGSGNFSAGTITAALNGNATTASSATNFSGVLAGDVTGTQGATIVSLVGGQTAADVAAGVVLANAATSSNTPNTIVLRDSSGNLSAGAISVSDEVMSGNLTITPFSTAGVIHNNASGLLSSSLVVNADVDPAAGIVDTKLATISTAGKVANSATTATSANTPNTIVLRDGSGNFSAGTITAALNGNALTATSTGSFSGSLNGDVTGLQGATVVGLVGGQTAVNVASATTLALAATNLNTPSAIVRRDASGNFSATEVTLDAGTSLSPSLQFNGSSNTGLSAAVANTLSFDTNGVQRLAINSSGITMSSPLILTNVFCQQAIQEAALTTLLPVVNANANTAILLLKPTLLVTLATIVFPPTPVDGQYFTIVSGSLLAIPLLNSAPGGATIVNGLTLLDLTINGLTASSYIYYAADNAWYRCG